MPSACRSVAANVAARTAGVATAATGVSSTASTMAATATTVATTAATRAGQGLGGEHEPTERCEEEKRGTGWQSRFHGINSNRTPRRVQYRPISRGEQLQQIIGWVVEAASSFRS